MQRLVLITALIGFAVGMPAQTAGPLAFEVASVKSSLSSGAGFRGSCHGIDSKYTPAEVSSTPPLGRCVITGGRLSHMIGLAYGVPSMGLIRGGPDWVAMGADRFNIQVKADDPGKTTEAQLLQMLQALLEDRFKLKYHRETAERPGYALVVGKNGPKLQKAKSDEVALSFGDAGKPAPGQPVALNARKFSMAMLANLLSQVGLGPVIDKTGLADVYDFKLNWDETNGPSLLTAVQEQLGLKLEPQKVPVSLFMVVSAQKPSEN